MDASQNAVALLAKGYQEEVANIAEEMTRLLPSSVIAWLKACNATGWQAGNGPERTEEILAQTREAMSLIFKSWRPARKDPSDLTLISAEVVKTLSVYGYGSIPSSDEQAKLKVMGFTEVLEEYPAWAVAAAGLWWRKNCIESPTPKAWATRVDVEMGKQAEIVIGGEKMPLGWVYDKVLNWAKGERVW